MNYLLPRRQTLVQNLKKTAAEAFLVTNPVNQVINTLLRSHLPHMKLE